MVNKQTASEAASRVTRYVVDDPLGLGGFKKNLIFSLLKPSFLFFSFLIQPLFSQLSPLSLRLFVAVTHRLKSVLRPAEASVTA